MAGLLSVDPGSAAIIAALISAGISAVVSAIGWVAGRRLSNEERLKLAKEIENLTSEQGAIQATMEQARAETAKLLLQMEAEKQPAVAGLKDVIVKDIRGPVENPAPATLADDCGPYTLGTIITEERRFYGRNEQLRRAIARLSGHGSVAVLGARRTGKTSFLYRLCGLTAGAPRSFSPDFILLYISAHEIGLRLPEGFWRQLLSRLLRAYERATGTELYGAPLPPTVSFSVVAEVIEHMTERGWKVVMAVDEFEALAVPDRFTALFFENMRSLAQLGRVSWLTASYRTPFEVLKAIPGRAGSDFANLFVPFDCHMNALTVAEAYELVARPLVGTPFEPPASSTTEIVSLAGRLPFALQVAANMRYDLRRLGDTGEAAAIGELKAAFPGAMAANFQHYFGGLLPGEQQELFRRANGRMGASTLRGSPALDLAQYGFLQPEGDDCEVYEVAGTAFRDWIRANA